MKDFVSLCRGTDMHEAQAVEQRQVLLVLGMHRSGTSLLSGLLAEAGVEQGRHLMPPSSDNPSGFWENQKIVELHERVLKSFGQSWASWKPLPRNWRHHDKVKRLRTELRALIIEEFGDKNLISIKDPRLCRLLPMWHDLADEMGLSLFFAIIHRSMPEVTASLRHRDGMGRAQAEALWLRYNMDLLRGIQGMPQVRTSYETLLSDPEVVLRDISQLLGRDLNVSDSDLLDPGLRHHNAGRAPAMPQWAELVQSWLGDQRLSPVPDTLEVLMPLVADLADSEQLLHRTQLRDVEIEENDLQNARESVLFTQAEEARKFAASLKEELSTSRPYIEDLKKSLARANAHSQSLQQHSENLEAIICERDKEIGSLSQHAQRLEEIISERDKEIRGLSQHSANQEEQLEKITTELSREFARFRVLRRLLELTRRKQP